MIDPNDVINYNRTDAELEEWFIFSVCVAGKTASTIAKQVETFLSGMEGNSPFDKLRLASRAGTLLDHMKRARLGKYNLLSKTFTECVTVNLRVDPVETFENIHGVASKTARMFIMHSRPNSRYAAIDTHILKHLREKGIDAPMVTPPSGKRYRQLEEHFLNLADEANMSPSEYDLEVWKSYSA